MAFRDRDVEARVVLVRHARPVIVPGKDASDWAMDSSAVGEVQDLATAMIGLGLDGVISSGEPKARETGRLIARWLSVSLEEDDDLREQGSGTVPWIGDGTAFRQQVLEHFARPEERVFGLESSSEAAARFAMAADRWRRVYRCPALVTHGRVMSAWMAAVTDTDPVEFWEDLLMPDAIVVDIDMRGWRRIGKERCI